MGCVASFLWNMLALKGAGKPQLPGLLILAKIFHDLIITEMKPKITQW